jgi:hypothetical protein
MKENQKKHGKLKALKIVMENVYSMGIFPQTSFNEFRKENMYFLTHLNIRQQKFEFRCYGFYEVCRRIKLKVTSEEVRDFIRSDEGTNSGTKI